MHMLGPFVALLGLATSGISNAADATKHHLKTYPIPSGVPVATSFELKVRSPCGAWKNVDLFRPNLHEMNQTTGSAIIRQSALAAFDFSGTVEISATYKKEAVSKARVRPNALGIVPEVSGSTVTFSLNEAQDFVLEVNDQVYDCLHIFANFPAPEEPEKDDESVVYFGPGYHQVSEQIRLTSGQTLFLAGGAVVTSPGVLVANATDVAIRGRGVFYSPRSTAIAIERSTDVVIEGGLIGINSLPRAYNSKRVTIRNWRDLWRDLSGVQWGDGLDFFCSEDILVDSVFLRNSDDCIALYSHRDQWYGDTKNITIQNSILWADVAHPINMGTHGNTANPETMDGITIRNIDVLDHREMQVSYQGVIALNAGDSNLIQNVLIDDVRVDDFRQGQLLNFRVMYNNKYNTSPGRGIRNVVVRDLVYNGDNAMISIFSGYNETRAIENVRFENLVINGKLISDTMRKPGWYLTSDYVPMYVNEHVRNLTFVG